MSKLCRHLYHWATTNQQNKQKTNHHMQNVKTLQTSIPLSYNHQQNKQKTNHNMQNVKTLQTSIPLSYNQPTKQAENQPQHAECQNSADIYTTELQPTNKTSRKPTTTCRMSKLCRHLYHWATTNQQNKQKTNHHMQNVKTLQISIPLSYNQPTKQAENQPQQVECYNSADIYTTELQPTNKKNRKPSTPWQVMKTTDTDTTELQPPTKQAENQAHHDRL